MKDGLNKKVDGLIDKAAGKAKEAVGKAKRRTINRSSVKARKIK